MSFTKRALRSLAARLQKPHRLRAHGAEGADGREKEVLGKMPEACISGADLADYPHIRGVLAYLDVTTTPDERATARETDQGAGLDEFDSVRCPAARLRDSLCARLEMAFKLRHTNRYPSPIGKELRHFRLYYPPQAANALAAAWRTRQRGGSALAVLQADYDWVSPFILSRPNWSDLPTKLRDTMKAFAEEGDELFYYECPIECGYELLRGRRLVHRDGVANIPNPHRPRAFGGKGAEGMKKEIPSNWMETLAGHAMARLRADFTARGQTGLYDAIAPFITHSSDESIAALSARLGRPEGTLKSDISRLRARCQELIRSQIAATLDDPTPANIDAELKELMGCRGN